MNVYSRVGGVWGVYRRRRRRLAAALAAAVAAAVGFSAGQRSGGTLPLHRLARCLREGKKERAWHQSSDDEVVSIA